MLMDREVWHAAVQRVRKSWTQMNNNNILMEAVKERVRREGTGRVLEGLRGQKQQRRMQEVLMLNYSEVGFLFLGPFTYAICLIQELLALDEAL